MFLKLGQTYYASLQVHDHNGTPVNDDIPMMTVQDKQTKEYYNGVLWQKQPISIAMMCVGGGSYTGQFTPNKAGEFTVTAESGRYGMSSVESVEVYDTVQATHSWQKGIKYSVEYSAKQVTEVSCEIISNDTGEYWTGLTWQAGEIAVPMTHVGNNKFSYTFVPQSTGEYLIRILCDGSQYQYMLNVVESAENIPPVIVTNQTLLSLDGSDSTVIAGNGFPLSGADVKVYDIATGEVAARTQTNSDGEWQLVLKPGVWQFLFEKDGYVSVSFERTVS